MVVALLAAEPRGERVREWLAAHPDGEASVSPWVDTEVSGALARKRRIREITAEIEVASRTVWSSAQGTVFRVVPIASADFVAASRLCAKRELTLRGADALHLAIVQRMGFAITTFDTGMAKAAGQIGLALAPLG